MATLSPIHWSGVPTTRTSGPLGSPPPRGLETKNYPGRGIAFRVLPHAATIGALGYLAVRIYGAATVPWISIPIAIAVFAAEAHSLFNTLFYAKDIRNEQRYEEWKRKNWPSDEQVDRYLGPLGPRVVMEVASAPEGPDTVLPTMQGVCEMEGNKVVTLNTQATLGGIFPEKLALVESLRRDYLEVWRRIRGITQNAATTGTQPLTVDLATLAAQWNVGHTERSERIGALTEWGSLNLDAKRNALRQIFEMLGQRHLIRGGIWMWWGSQTATLPEVGEMAELMKRVFDGSLTNLGERPIEGLWREVDIRGYAFPSPAGPLSFADHLPALAEKVRENLFRAMAATTPEERAVFGFEYMTSLVVLSKLDQAAHEADGLQYFPRNIRSGGEDIKLGLEYEACATESAEWSEEQLDREFNKIVNSFVNNQVVWWDRDRLADHTHAGKKATSISTLVHILDGNWVKIMKAEEAALMEDLYGIIIHDIEPQKIHETTAALLSKKIKEKIAKDRKAVVQAARAELIRRKRAGEVVTYSTAISAVRETAPYGAVMAVLTEKYNHLPTPTGKEAAELATRTARFDQTFRELNAASTIDPMIFQSLSDGMNPRKTPWDKVESDFDHQILVDVAASLQGYLVAKDFWSAWMRLCLEELENGQMFYEALSHRSHRNDWDGLEANTLTERLARMAGELSSQGFVPRRRIYVERILQQLQADPALMSNEKLIRALTELEFYPATPSPKLTDAIRIAAGVLRRTNDPAAQRRALQFFVRTERDNLNATVSQGTIHQMVLRAGLDMQIPPEYEVVDVYEFENTPHFNNIDAEVRPRREYMAKLIAFLQRIRDVGEDPPSG